MLEFRLTVQELFDEKSESFRVVTEDEMNVEMEYSLKAISKWESKWKVPFFSRKLNPEELLDFVRCMDLKGSLDVNLLTQSEFEKIFEYISDPYSATTVIKDEGGPGRVITSEVVYASMASRSIPFTCDEWHVNRLFKLIDVYDASTKEPKKMSQRDIIEQNRSLNAERRKQLKKG